MVYISKPWSWNCGNCAIKIMMASALTKPVTTDRETKRIKLPNFSAPAMICSTPVKMVAGSRYSSPWSRTSATSSTAMAPVAAEIIPGRPPTKAMTTAIQKDAYSPTFGSTPAIMEKAIASGMRASATTVPAITSRRGFENHSWKYLFCVIARKK